MRMRSFLGLGAFALAAAVACSSSGTSTTSSSGEAPSNTVDSGTSDLDAAAEAATVDARVEAGPTGCPTCNAAGYDCVAPAAGGSVQLDAVKQPDGSCKLSNGRVTLKCGGSGTAANGAPYSWIEGADGRLQLGTGQSQLQCTPK